MVFLKIWTKTWEENTMPQAPDSEIPFYSSSDEMRSRPFERADRESVRTNDPLRAAHEFLFRGGTGEAVGEASVPREEKAARKSTPWLIPLVVGCIAVGIVLGYMASSTIKEDVNPLEMTPGKMITTTQAGEM